MVLLLLIHCYCLLLFLGGVFCYAVLTVLSSFAIILLRKSELVVLLWLSLLCQVDESVLCLFLTVPWVGLRCVIKAFPGHTHFWNAR